MKIDIYIQVEDLIRNGFSCRNRDMYYFLEKGIYTVFLYFDGQQTWFRHGGYHRSNNLPAIVRTNCRIWYDKGVKYREEHF